MNRETQDLIDEMYKYLTAEEEALIRQVQLHFDRTRRTLFEFQKNAERLKETESALTY